ncbi:zf-HC2 domain-containing protein [Streptomyces sp. NBC_00647]|uniref:zf-HC2 domain-containing protein n=1 Tax=Streptomyces sp. NBC_00647 TaxID=2975796 RepID=UPI00325107F7
MIRVPHPPPWLRAVPGLRWPWLLAVTGVCAAGAWLAATAGAEDSLPVLLLLAPVLPLIWVAASYGGRADPFAPVIRSTPAGGLRLLMLRTGVVLAICLPLLVVAAMAGVGVSAWAAAWLVPSLGLTLVTLLLGSYIGCLLAAGVTSGTWLVIITAVAHLSMRQDGRVSSFRTVLLNVLKNVLDGGAQFVWGAASGLLSALLVLRRHSFNDLRSR